MKLDFSTHATVALIFSLTGLTIMLVGSMAQLPVSDALAATLGSIVVATLGVEGYRASRGSPDSNDSPTQPPPGGQKGDDV